MKHVLLFLSFYFLSFGNTFAQVKVFHEPTLGVREIDQSELSHTQRYSYEYAKYCSEHLRCFSEKDVGGGIWRNMESSTMISTYKVGEMISYFKFTYSPSVADGKVYLTFFEPVNEANKERFIKSHMIIAKYIGEKLCALEQFSDVPHGYSATLNLQILSYALKWSKKM